MNLTWQVAIIVAFVAALGSVVVALVGRGSNKEANAVTFSADLVKEVRELKKDAKTNEKRLARIERVLDGALDHIDATERWVAQGADPDTKPGQPWEVQEYRRLRAEEYASAHDEA